MAFPEDLVEVVDKGLRVAEQAEKEQELPEVLPVQIPLVLVGEMMVEQTHILAVRIMAVVEVVEHNTTECQEKTPIVFQLNMPCIHTQEMVVMV